MRKYISLLILSVFLFNIGGYYLWFAVLHYKLQNEVRQEIRKGLRDEDLTLIVVPSNDASGISWIKTGKEFRYKGEMYDVVRVSKHLQQTHYYCITDTKEKQLLAGFNKTHTSKKEYEKKIKRTLTFNYFLQSYLILKNQYAVDQHFASIPILYQSNTIEIHSPPPKTV